MCLTELESKRGSYVEHELGHLEHTATLFDRLA